MIDKLENILINGNCFGNKAKNLSILKNKGILIPEGIAISFEHYFDYISSKSFSEHFKKRIFDFAHKLIEPYAVRSSANIEDSTDNSYAGQFFTQLAIYKENLFEAIKKVYLSAIMFTRPEVLKKIKMGLIIQEMIESDISGVLFSYNLIDEDASSIMTEVTRGRCEKIVSGKVNPSLYIIDKNSKEIKLFEGGDQEVILNKSEINQILKNSTYIEDIFKYPQDIEFLFNQNKFYCLQSRNITTLKKCLNN